jgi:hypothetical protein
VSHGISKTNSSLARGAFELSRLSADVAPSAGSLIEENKPVLLALARVLIDHPERTLNAAEIDEVIAQTLGRQALAAEQGRRTAWRQVTERVAEITP